MHICVNLNWMLPKGVIAILAKGRYAIASRARNHQANNQEEVAGANGLAW